LEGLEELRLNQDNIGWVVERRRIVLINSH